MTKILRFPCDLARTMRNTLREFLIVIATVAKASCKHGLWLVVRVNYKKFGGTAFSPPVLHLIIKFISDPPNRKYKLWFIRIRFNLLSQFSNKCHDITVI